MIEGFTTVGLQTRGSGPAALREQKLGDEAEYLRLATREYAGSTTFRTGTGHIYYELMDQLPRIAEQEKNRVLLSHRIEQAIYPLAARLLAQAVEITLNFSPAPQDFPTAPRTMLTATGFDIGQKKIIHAFIPPKRQRWGSVNRPKEPVTIASGLLVTCRPLRYRYHALKDTRKKWKHIKSNIFRNWSRRDLQRFEEELKEITAWLGKKPLFNPALWKSAPVRKVLEPITPEPEEETLALTPAMTLAASLLPSPLPQKTMPPPPQASLQRSVKPAASPRITTATEAPKKKEQAPIPRLKSPAQQTQPTPVILPQPSTAPPRLAPVALAPETVALRATSTTPRIAPLILQQPLPSHAIAPPLHKTAQPSPTPRIEPVKIERIKIAPAIAEKPTPQRLPEPETKLTAPQLSPPITRAAPLPPAPPPPQRKPKLAPMPPPHEQRPSNVTIPTAPKPAARKEEKIDLIAHKALSPVPTPIAMATTAHPAHTTTPLPPQPQPALPPQRPIAPKPAPATSMQPTATPQQASPKEQPRAKPTMPEPMRTEPQQQPHPQQQAPRPEATPLEPQQQTQPPQTQREPRPEPARAQAQPQPQPRQQVAEEQKPQPRMEETKPKLPTEQPKPTLRQQEYAVRHEITRQPIPPETRPKPSPRIATTATPETRPTDSFRPVHDFEQPLAQRFRAHQYAHQQGLRMEPRIMPKQRPILVATAKLEPKAEYKAIPKVEPKTSPKTAPSPRQQPQSRWAFLSPSPTPSPSGFFAGRTTRKA